MKCTTMLVAAALAAVTPLAPAAERSVEPERCLQLSRVDSTEVLNNRQILFRTRAREYFVNNLPHPCPGLRRGSTLMFRTSIDLVCDVDVVTVVESMGWGMRPGASCGLGRFEPVDEGEVEQLRQARGG
jgi:hypothetical protein